MLAATMMAGQKWWEKEEVRLGRCADLLAHATSATCIVIADLIPALPLKTLVKPGGSNQVMLFPIISICTKQSAQTIII